jgi:putative membrane protein
MDRAATEEQESRLGNLLVRQFHWRMVLVRVLVNGLSLLITAALVPHVYLPEWSLVSILSLGVILGLLNAIVRPVLQFLTLSFIFVTYGLVIVMINTIILLLLATLFPGRLGVDSLFWALIAGAVMGIVSGALESLLGLSLPILPEGSGSPRAIVRGEHPATVPAYAETAVIAGVKTAGKDRAIEEPQLELPASEMRPALDSLPTSGTAGGSSAGEGHGSPEQSSSSSSAQEEEP